MKAVLVVPASLILLGLAFAVGGRSTGEGSSEVEGKERMPDSVSAGIAVVELFTSEGCSSCPPADELLNSIAAEARASGRNIFPIAFHVDYWNRLGWKDRFSDEINTQRQRSYAQTMKLRSIYTPQMIVNGTTEFVGSNRSRAISAIETALAEPAPVSVDLETELTEDSSLSVRYRIADGEGDLMINIALVERELLTEVPRGENAGRTLKHDNVVRSFRSIPLEGSSSGEVQLRIPADVSLEKSDVMAYIQDGGTLAIVGAESVPVPMAD